MHDCIHLVAESKNIQTLKSPELAHYFHRYTTVISECHPCGTATKLRHQSEEAANGCSVPGLVRFGQGHTDRFYKGSIIAIVTETQIYF